MYSDTFFFQILEVEPGLRRRSGLLSAGGASWRSRAAVKWCRSGEALPQATVDGRLGQEEASEAPFFFFFFPSLFNILKCDERINGARLPDPYVPFSAACA